jgi:response regulator RpfG family c-di-GMP phosphodiesterase
MSASNNDQRRVLLIDPDSLKQKLRAAALRNCEVEVHTASDAADAGPLWRAYAYDLVLVAAEENSEEAAALCSKLKKSKPKHRIALLVGAPQ